MTLYQPSFMPETATTVPSGMLQSNCASIEDLVRSAREEAVILAKSG